MTCIAIGKTTHGKWSYYTVVTYTSKQNKKGQYVWQKVEILLEATTMAKIEKLATDRATSLNLPLLPRVRHNDFVVPFVG